MTPGAMRSTGDEFGSRDRTFVVDGLTERVHDTADHGLADGDAHDASGALDFVAFLDFGEVAEQHGADLVFFQVHGESVDACAGTAIISPAITFSRP